MAQNLQNEITAHETGGEATKATQGDEMEKPDKRTTDDFAFFCLLWLRMTPAQVAEMICPEGGSDQKIMEIYINDRWTYTIAYAAARGHFLR